MSGQHGPDLDHEHHRVLPLDVGPEHHQRLPESRLQQFRLEQAGLSAVPAPEFEFVGGGAGDRRFLSERARHVLFPYLVTVLSYVVFMSRSL